ncbi:MAG: queuosine precursor transporter [Synergistales bacterium]|nr:queuosine precursor transporter [Synergistales bacterium]
MHNELLWLVLLCVNFGGILLAYVLWGRYGLYCWVAMAAIVANIQVLKTVSLFGLVATLGNIVYATSFLATDILSENHGPAAARKAVYIGFFSLAFATGMMWLALRFTPHSSDFAQQALETIFAIMPRVTAASLLAYLSSQLHDIWAYDLWRRRFPAVKHIWIRNNLSTAVSQLLDSLVFVSVAFLGVFPPPVLLDILLTTYLLKLVVAAADTPLVYIARRLRDRGSIPSEAD